MWNYIYEDKVKVRKIMNMDTGESGSFETREFSIRGRGRRKIVFQNNISLDLTVGYLIDQR